MAIFNGTAGPDSLSGTDFDDQLFGLDGDDLLVGKGGNDILEGGTGVDQLDGGLGNDRYYIDDALDKVIEASGAGADIVLSAVSYVLANGVYVEGLATRDLSATTAINLTGNSFANTISGNAGDNVLNGAGGVDIMQGYGGNDRYYVDDARDQIIEEAGGGTDIVLTSTGYLRREGVSVENISTSDWSSTKAIQLTGNSLDNQLSGNAGINYLDGGAGADVMRGFGGNDIYFFDNVGDRVIETGGRAGGIDEIHTKLASFSLAAAPAVEWLTGGASVDRRLTGNDLDNRIRSGFGDDVLIGGAGNDELSGSKGSDRYYVDSAGDVVLETTSDAGVDLVLTSVSYALLSANGIEGLSTADWSATTAISLTGNNLANALTGNAGANTLIGNGGNDSLVGLGGVDTLQGGAGNDALFGGLGADSLTGGTGADLFRFDSALGGGNIDSITDFASVDDSVWLDDALFTGLARGALADGAFVTGAAAADADDRIIYNSATGALLFDADGVDGAAAVQFATLQTGLALTASDFFVV